MPLDQETIIELQHKLDQCKREHQQLDFEINWLARESDHDVVHIHRLKKQKLLLKDQIVKIDALLVPNIIA